VRLKAQKIVSGLFANIVLRQGAKGVVCGPEGALLADGCALIKLRKCHTFLPSPIHACPRHGPWATS